eukprot:16427921-Heterocapsa_arctica.AAC.1
MMLNEYDATHEDGEDDFDVCAWCVDNCSPESYEKNSRVRSDRKLTASEVNEVRQGILQHYFATIVCGASFRRHINIE